MPKLIDADKLKEHYAWWDNEDKKIFDTIVDLQPIVDAVEVVRCKDCVYYNEREGFCEYLSNNYAPAVDMEENDFCSKGKRREDEAD